MTPEGKILQARMKLRKEIPFVGDLLTYLHPQMDPSMETMGVNTKNELFVNPAWVEGLTPDQVKAVITHEVMHLALLHPFRNPPEVAERIRLGLPLTAAHQRQHRIMNYATDLKINFMFHELGTFQHLPESDFKPDKNGNWMHTPADGGAAIRITGIDKKSAEQIYRELLAQMPPCVNMDAQLICSHAGWPTVSAAGEGKDKGKGSSGSAQDMQVMEEAAGDWLVRAAGALASDKGRGSMPASMLRALNELLTPKIDWHGKLQRFVQPIVACGYSYRRPRRTSWVTGTIMPGPDRGGVHIIGHVDTSGSMRPPELEQIAGELYGVLDAHPHVRITLLHSDAGKPEVIELRETDKDDITSLVNLEGGGGTSHIPVVDWVLENNDEAVQALICFTDGISDIQHCFDRLSGVVTRMLVLTREDQIEKLEPFCDDTAYLPTD